MFWFSEENEKNKISRNIHGFLKSTRESFNFIAVYKRQKTKRRKRQCQHLFTVLLYYKTGLDILILLRTIKCFYYFTDMITVLLRTIFGLKLFKDYTACMYIKFESLIQYLSINVFIPIRHYLIVDEILRMRRCVRCSSLPGLICAAPGACDLILATIRLIRFRYCTRKELFMAGCIKVSSQFSTIFIHVYTIFK